MTPHAIGTDDVAQAVNQEPEEIQRKELLRIVICRDHLGMPVPGKEGNSSFNRRHLNALKGYMDGDHYYPRRFLFGDDTLSTRKMRKKLAHSVFGLYDKDDPDSEHHYDVGSESTYPGGKPYNRYQLEQILHQLRENPDERNKAPVNSDA